MDKNIIKSFAVESRQQMIESVKYQASLIGITSDGISEPISKAEGMETYDYGAGTYTIFDEDIYKRKSLVHEVKNKSFDNVMEEVAYTWFNRIIAIRFMEVNDYLPTRTRVLSSDISGKVEPDIVTDALDLDLDYTSEDTELIFKLKEENKLDDLFQLLFIKQCNKLSEILPGLFEKTDDYMELLLNISFTNPNGIIRNLVDLIPEKDFNNQVEIIGWLYQYYNIKLKEDAFLKLKKNIKISKERIPAATQLFTPNWIVKYMVENSLGKLWLEGNHNEDFKSKMEYYIDEIAQDSNVESDLIYLRNESESISLEDIKIIDPCMGSGHILVYVFDLLMQIYISEGYLIKDAVEKILKNNIYGLDIDDRAYQLAYFALMMKARSYHRNIFNLNIIPSLKSIKESNSISDKFLEFFNTKYPNHHESLNLILKKFKDAKLYGSLIEIDECNFMELKQALNEIKNTNDLTSFKFNKDLDLLNDIINQAIILNTKYNIVITNPPYMGANNMDLKLKEYLKDRFPSTKTDLFSSFIEKGFQMLKEGGFNVMVTMQGWMFNSTFEEFRKKLIKDSIICNLLHMDNGVMGIAFGTSATVFRKHHNLNFKGVYNHITLNDINEMGVPYEFPNPNNRNNNVSLSDFNLIPGMPIAYWVEENVLDAFNDGKQLQDLSEVKIGLTTGDNNHFLRFWFEVNKHDIGFNFNPSSDFKNANFKWFPHNKGGSFRRWYGNQDYVIDWEKDGERLKNFNKSVLRNSSYYFKECVSWSTVTNGKVSYRYFPQGFTFNNAAGSLFIPKDKQNYIFGFLNTKLSQEILDLIVPTVFKSVGYVSLIPIIYDMNAFDKVNSTVEDNIKISKNDWDDYELSWNFLSHPFMRFNESNLENRFNYWKLYKEKQFNSLKINEMKLNQIFNNIYHNDGDDDIEDKYVSISKANHESDAKSFISYAVGCMFGRYSLDDDGLQFAGGTFDLTNYSKFIPDDDNIIPVLDTEYFEDDIVGRFVEFVKVCFGEETLEENLDFIANSLNKKGNTSREKIRNYFLTDFFKDHAKIYKKCPIYWQFDSGKQNAFKCLIYMHRYDPSIVARVRTDYLHKTQKAIEQNLSSCDNIIANSSNKSEISKATKDKAKYIKQLDEIRVYDEALGHMATQNIKIDLDDGVKVNYTKFQKVEISKEGEKTKKINLLKNI